MLRVWTHTIATLFVVACGKTERPPAPSEPEAVASAQTPALGVPALHAMKFRQPYAEANYEFLRAYVADRSIVQLGESIHVTEEFPRARLHLVRFLHERLRFDVLALEGSLVDAWLAQDLIFRSTSAPPETSKQAQDTAWFPLWNTEPMLELMEYVVATHSTDSPLYLASFDIQPGNTRRFRGDGQAAVTALIEAIGTYGRPSAATDVWARSIAPFFSCMRAKKPRSEAEKRAAAEAVAELERWIATVAPEVAAKTSSVHASALRRIPDTLRDSVALCTGVTEAGASYQELRDRHNAKNVLFLRDHVSPSRKVIAWAHHSHVNHNSTGKNTPSMGQHLLAAGPDAVYTVGLFAGRGTAMAVDDDSCPQIAVRPLAEAQRYGVEKLLSATGTDDYFVDLSKVEPDSAWLAPTTTRMEIGWPMHVRLAKDFHAAVFVQETHHAELRFVPALMRAAMAFDCRPGSGSATR